MTNSLLQLQQQGQSVWYDNIDRSQLASGEFKRLLDENGILGVTANPTIFEKSISHGHAYDEQISQLISEGKSTNEIYEAVIIQDIRTVADLLRPIYDRSDGKDGYVSLEVSPELAHDTEGTVKEAARFWNMVERPNLMIKIPATPEGIPAVYETLRNGINVNITLIFSLDSYRAVTDAFLRALEERNSEGNDVSKMGSVASFFVSRVDTLVDKLLEDKIKASSDPAEQQSLKHVGVNVQRPLWASTSTKNPAYRDVLYAEELIGPDTVDTMPLETIENFSDHGQVRNTVEDDIAGAHQIFDELEKVGIHYDQVTQQLLDEGVQKFADSFHQLFAGIDGKKNAIKEGQTTH
jgi:transaldolase